MSTAFERIKELADKQGLSLNDLENKLSISKNSLYGIKKANPKSDRLQEIADYFNVSTDYLLGRTDNPRIASDETEKFYFEGKEVDVEHLASTAMRFNGKPLSDEDKKAIQNIIEIYLRK
ncbi:TPA: helix-turn-helix transcriptional regulator [Streptococcus suis]|uniref:helix-turn-helix domain-containing protein n=1 Tax=Streptococcus suis TaxID=1307 RepID=UPI0005BAE0BA|nr:helix-turn-helix transcriptional regulator [Streptococcus suis]NQH41533.1 helix-turn-helix transcriptional regulator [Streptococcus suis]NQH56419.1 helix-turn-helix transcriptional regulator [Streptococcus suis]NQO52920.1 helix-turn-helix transcriptional regulator [Streptococcus suis]NQR53996.1 helix-turn-helix transcriptional regulator [Streptococcus suis]CYU97346.1 DNA-binding protein [Streptococcus suis]